MHDPAYRLSPDAKRWKIAHRAFFTQTQGLLLAIAAYERDPSESRLGDIVELLLGSPVMMMFAADFMEEDYAWVRDDMTKVDQKFSGQYSADHAELLRRLSGLKSAQKSFPMAHDRLAGALEAVYHAHALVCRNFVGDKGSLANPDADAPQLLRTKFLRRALIIAGAVARAREVDRRGRDDA
ncbi:MAG: hypothetical protein MUE84_15335 [Hyphomonas sp.]|jgi:hypothetical protein|nr:hypothetical protein [Hyphomonas sp.]